jgi:SAM-dependent methyltransferase/uncharacterized protein YbaR (Trm112 family)
VIETETAATAVPLELACPACRAALDVQQDEARCPACRAVYARHDGIWRFLDPERAVAFERFVREYHTIRRAEGWGVPDAAYFRALPWRDLTGRHADLWRIRAKTFATFVERVLAPLERARPTPLAVLDLGAGNGWLAYRFAQRGHTVAAVDVATDPLDGLGACAYYDAPVVALQADYDRLPLASGRVDLAVFGAALHYSPDYRATLGEALRVVRPDGLLAILDSPLYHDPASGRQMVRERERQFEAAYGFASNALPSEQFLTPRRLDELARDLGLAWRVLEPFYGWRWALRPWRARLRGRREPARFRILVGRRSAT